MSSDREGAEEVKAGPGGAAARAAIAAGAVLAAIVVLLPVLALSRPGMFGPVWAAAFWGFGLVVSFTGWGGWLWRRLVPARDVDLGLRAAWGLGLTVVVGGLLCLLGAARRPVLLAWVFGGLALAASEAHAWVLARATGQRSLRDLLRWRWDAAVVAVLAAFVAIAFVGAATRDQPNPNDDWLAYLPFARELVQTGTLVEPFSLRRMAAYGGQSLLQALTLLGADDAQVHLFDTGICRLILVALVLGFSREAVRASRLTILLLAVAVAMLPEVRSNSSSEASGAVAFIAIARTMIWVDRNHEHGMRGAFLIALPLAAVCTLRQNYQVGAAAMLAAMPFGGLRIEGPVRRRAALRVAALTAACLLPWAALAFRSNHSFLFPLFHGNYDPAYTALTPKSSLRAGLHLLVTAAVAGDPVRVMVLLMLAAPALARLWHTRSVAGLTAAAIAGLTLLVLSLPEAELGSIQRYFFAGSVAFMVGIGLAASEYPASAGGRADGAIVVVVLAALALQVHGTLAAPEKNLHRAIDRLAAHDRSPPPLAAQQPEVRRLQEAVPAGERLLVMIERPYLLDFTRNKIVLIDQPGAVSPPPGLKFSEGADRVVEYLVGQGIRYFALSFPDKAQNLYGRATWIKLQSGMSPFWRQATPVYLQAFAVVDDIAKTRRRIYDDGQMAVIDLATRAP